MALTYSKTFRITEEHLDRNQHVNNVQYVHWVEEAAGEHWELVKDKTDYTDDYWVLVDHHIQYKKQVFLGDEMTVKTYPENPAGLKQPRKVEFYVGGELVVDSRTIWVLFEGENQRIRRIDADWLEKLEKNLQV